MRKIIYLTLIFVLCLGLVMPADACAKIFHPDPTSTVAWMEKSREGTDAKGADIHETRDGGYIMAGTVQSPGSPGSTKILVQKMDASHNITWEHMLGGEGKSEGRRVRETRDGGYIVVGMTNSNNGDMQGLNHGGWDVVLGKLSSTGTQEWVRCYGGSRDDFGENIRETQNGYTVIGRTFSRDGDVSGPDANVTIPIPRITFGPVIAPAPSMQFSWNISDEELLAYLMDDTLHESPGGQSDAWLFEVDPAGNLLWQQRYGGILDDYGYDFLQMEDGGILFAGATRSNIGESPSNHGGSAGTLDGWLVRLRPDHTVEWQKCLGGSNNDGFFSIEPTQYTTTDGGCGHDLSPVLVNKSGYILAGFAGSDDGSVFPRPNKGHESYDGWLVRLNADFSIKWTKCLGGSQLDIITSAQQTNKAKYIFTGLTRSSDGDVGRATPPGTGPVPWTGLFYRCDNVIDWQLFPAGNQTGILRSVEITRDGGYLAAGWASPKESNPTNTGDTIATNSLQFRLSSPLPAAPVSRNSLVADPAGSLADNSTAVKSTTLHTGVSTTRASASPLGILLPCAAAGCAVLAAALVRKLKRHE
nr:hypothetical protein [uncultured Methanoregula sp.]